MFAIRPADADDLTAIHLLLEDCHLPIEDVTAAHLSRFLVLHNGASIVGCVGLEAHGQDALLRSLALHGSVRGNGWGQRLTAAMEAQAQRVGISTFYLLTTTAAAFFEAQGYRRIDRAAAPLSLQKTSQFSSVCPSAAICMFKSITSNS